MLSKHPCSASIDSFGVRVILPPVSVAQGPLLSRGACVLVSPAIKSPKMYEKGQVQAIGLQSFVSCPRMSMLGHYSQAKLHHLIALTNPNLTSRVCYILKDPLQRNLLTACKVLRSIFLLKGIIHRQCSKDYLNSELRK